jgi:chromosome segregation ATPase
MALDDPRAIPPGSLHVFWDRLRKLEEQHREAKRQHESARRRLEASRGAVDGELRQCWEAYCDAIANLDATTSELEQFRGGAIRVFAD